MKFTRVGAGWLLGFSQRTTGIPLEELELELELEDDDELLEEDEDEELDEELEELDELELELEEDELLEEAGSPPQPTNARVTAAVKSFTTR